MFREFLDRNIWGISPVFCLSADIVFQCLNMASSGACLARVNSTTFSPVLSFSPWELSTMKLLGTFWILSFIKHPISTSGAACLLFFPQPHVLCLYQFNYLFKKLYLSSKCHPRPLSRRQRAKEQPQPKASTTNWVCYRGKGKSRLGSLPEVEL